MARIRHIKINGFRSIAKLEWRPFPGTNCIIGPGDSGKSTILEAIDWCLGSRRSLTVTDADFHKLNVNKAIEVEITLGDLDDSLRSFETYGLFLRGFNPNTGAIEDEPGANLESALTVKFIVESDLEPYWMLVSKRADDQGVTRNLSWADRLKIAPTRIGSYATQHLSWRRGSLLTRLSEERADVSAKLAEAARTARESFGNSAGDQLNETLNLVSEAADELGVPYGGKVRAMLDAHSVSFNDGTISLHNSDGVPLTRLGLGSARLLVAGIQDRTSSETSIALVDEVEHGLEPHRIARFLAALGTKDAEAPIQTFMTTHSPVVVRELNENQLQVLRKGETEHLIIRTSEIEAAQGTLRGSAEAFFGTHTVVCEGATEIGLIRGFDLRRAKGKKPTFASAGGTLADGGGVNNIYRRAKVFLALGYKCAVLRDDDRQPNDDDEPTFQGSSGAVFKWADGNATEDQIFKGVSDIAFQALIMLAIEFHGKDAIQENLASAASSPVDISTWANSASDEKRTIAAKAAKSSGWFKQIALMERAAYEILSVDEAPRDSRLADTIHAIFDWAEVGHG